MIALLAAGAMAAVGAGPATAAGGLLPHPGPDGLVWVEEMVGDGGVASGGAWDGLPTVLTVACEGDGTVHVTMDSQGYQVADFTVDCPAGTAGTGAVTKDPGVVRPGSFSIGVDASDDTIRWALTVTQPE
ncbi:hypothetical protein GCM10010275_71520 [Streptomyces litmocidini]|uniref:hypothetical protein n=1 Tax=Streptomyces litmocidini TaxID=67318 RepID=UPI0019A486F7|nr:hypothetical protein [Streptomyces litmocidini]GGV19472.1 hypothetical protein GCM10010275_71520 [Streptomyces litmocidini]